MNKPNAEIEGKSKFEFIQFFVKLPSLEAFVCPEDFAAKMGNFEDILICWFAISFRPQVFCSLVSIAPKA
jgi:hypothetical protein